ncbi:hypothetical protein CY35_10G064700 [Sphagnum magellanicum]|nr:hypothetical protein CY35_10G064700 [Sphagnum magellanicum]KAH9550305.1 hypothetical protein CY35_10G064700 [Sphagnum magellanicum]KAH9550306.1 hypothetical protein CY35_10G064700 [Sphagnum magellanicum]KAH9550307.1 hypothetical protein CY35_10G064700 [Sphagnum magellanicum]KAH9550308.1 hypothetical protein CY35_10G064700 [Sphagnum magellanicum]
MSEQQPADAAVAETVAAVVDNIQNVPANQSAPADKYVSTPRLFGRKQPIHQVLGGGTTADVLLWRKKHFSIGMLVGATLAWILLEKTGYKLVSVVSNVTLFLVVILFVWSNLAVLLNRALPPLPELSLSEEFVIRTANSVRLELNKALAIAHDVALGKDFKLFLKVIAVLWIASTVGGRFHLLTLLYICIVLAQTLPFIYDKYEDVIDDHANRISEQAQAHYKKLDENVFSKIPRAPVKEKKNQ